MSARVLITGATGFLGAHLVRALLAAGWQVHAAARAGSDRWRLAGVEPHERLRQGTFDLLDTPSAARVVDAASPDLVVHCAAIGAVRASSATEVAANLTGTLALYEAAQRARVGRFLHFGTGYAYGARDAAATEDQPLDPLGLYGAAKAATALMLREASRGAALRPLLLRLYNLYGPLDHPGRLVPQIVDAARTGRPLEMSSGEQKRDYVWIDDVVRLVVGLAELPEPRWPGGEVFNVCTGHPTTVRAFALELADALGARHLLKVGAVAAHEGEAKHVYGSPAKLQAFLREQGLDHLLHFRRPSTVAASLTAST